MPIPHYQAMMRPLLSYAADGLEKNIGGAITFVADQLKLSDEEKDQLLPSGKKRIISDRVHWARTYLDKAGAVKKTKRAHFVITERGKKLLAENPEQIGISELKQFPEFLTFWLPKTSADTDQIEKAEVGDPPQVSATPEEAIQQAQTQINTNIRSQLLERIGELSPSFFERLVVDLIIAMGYGGSRGSVVQKLGKSGDEGIDGVINEDALGLDVIYLQAKRYAKDNTIGREKIQQFAGALVGQGASKGVFVSTSSFTKTAFDYVKKIPQKIILIDGEELTRLMVNYGVGVRTEETIDIKRIDLDYFEESDE
jgi:restriction system protein